MGVYSEYLDNLKGFQAITAERKKQLTRIASIRVLVKCCGNSFQHCFALAPRACQLRHLFSLENSVFKRTALQDQGHQITAAIERSPVPA